MNCLSQRLNKKLCDTYATDLTGKVNLAYRTHLKGAAKLYKERGKSYDSLHPTGTTFFTNKLVLPIPKSIHELLNDPIRHSLHPHSIATIKENRHTLTNLTTTWNKIAKIYEHPIKGPILLKLEYPVPLHRCSF